ncbi:MAG: translocation/assembly module TamB domain-containing protein [Planctomycetota bacterium]|nr:translocation/assembly module TamB domain-containing protein [Planctomycetota bacterium]
MAGTPSRPGGWASLRLEAGRLGKLPLDKLVAHLRYEEGRLSLDGLEAKLQGGRGGASLAGQAEWFPAGAVVGQFRHLDLRWDDATLSASSPLEFRSERGAVDIGEWVFDSSSGPMRLGGVRSADGTIDLSVDAPRVDLEPTLRLLGMEDPPTGEVGISGRLTAGAGPLSLEADARFRGIAWQGISATSGELNIAVDGERINIHTARLRGVAGGEIWARGEIPLGNPSEPIRLLLDARDLDLTRLLDPIESIRLPKGTLRAQLLATGTWDDPYLHGYIRVDDGAARFPRPVPALEGFSGTIRFGGRRHQLEAVALLGNEKAKLSGEVVTKGLEPESIDFTIQGKNLLIAHSRDLRARSDVDLRLHGIPGELVLSGDVHLRRARYYRDLEQGGEGPGAGPGDEGALAGVAPILLDVRIDSEDDVWIDNRESLSQFRLEIQLEGTTRNPGVRGVVSCLGGKYRYYGRTFRINSALVDFDEEDLVNPRVDIAATSRVAGVDIFLVVRGRLKSPQIDLASDPPYPDADILSLLSLGYTREGAVGAGGVSLAFTQAAHWLVGFIGEIFRTRDREVTFVDRITVEGSLGEGIESSQLKVIYEVTDQVAVQSERDEYGYFNFDVFFLRLRF